MKRHHKMLHCDAIVTRSRWLIFPRKDTEKMNTATKNNAFATSDYDNLADAREMIAGSKLIILALMEAQSQIENSSLAVLYNALDCAGQKLTKLSR